MLECANCWSEIQTIRSSRANRNNTQTPTKYYDFFIILLAVCLVFSVYLRSTACCFAGLIAACMHVFFILSKEELQL